MTQVNPYGAAPQAPPGWGVPPAPPSYGYPQQPAQTPYGYAQQPVYRPNRAARIGRTPLIALAAIAALLVGGGFVWSARASKAGPTPAAVRRKKPATAPDARSAAKPPAASTATKPARKPSASTAAKPSAKPAAKPAVPITWVEITAANSGTAGAAYRIAQPTGFTFRRGTGKATAKADHLDLYLSNESLELGLLSYAWDGLPEGTLPADLVAELRKGWLTSKGRTALPGTSAATIGGNRATGFDFTVKEKDGSTTRARLVFFGHGGTLHTAVWFAPAAKFAASLPTFQHIVATLNFTGTITRHRSTTAST